jgi:alkanesulfonate monooxygenase SsuD/methylene tetrahydromethanopterin reductase-like flavin-dependent oxidoreductase (luciferase family)
MDEAITLLRSCWSDERIDQRGERFHANVIAMEPKPPNGARLPIWIGGSAPAALRRTGQVGDGWMGSATGDETQDRAAIAEIRRHAEAAGRDPMAIELQAMLAPPPRDAGGKTFYQDHDRVVRRAEQLQALGFGWVAINATAIFQAGARSVDAMIDSLGTLHGRLRAALG